ncbi:MAG: glutathione transferase GstA [Gammaproteobacteria bacterium]|nr:glutathione transferase GstA [Gammaproteobacteria bacterium]
MKLFFSPAACSLASHIALLEAGLKFTAVKVDLRHKTLADGSDYRRINPLGCVPALQLKNGEVLTEGPAILQYIADQAPASNLAPANGSFARYKLQSWLNFIATELHKNFTPLFDPTTVEAAKLSAQQKLTQRFSYLDQQLGALQYLVGDYFTIADAYLFTVSGWAKFVKFDLTPYPNLLRYVARCNLRPAVLAAMAAEGL